nr:MATE family efflux transporter [Clostridioides difficile]
MVKKQFLKNVLPSMLAFAFSGVYAIVDGWFVGRNIGDAGLAAINIAYPLTALIQAIGTGIGMGGAIQIAICLGRGDEDENKYLGNTIFILLLACIISTIILGLTSQSILRIFGAEGEILNHAISYIKIIIYGATFQIIGTGLIPIIRNYNGSLVAMSSMIAGFLTNVVLDWLFVSVYSYGLVGAAIATVIGQMVTLLPCILFLTIKKKLFGFAIFKPIPYFLKKIMEVAVSPFGLTLSPNIVIIILNKGAISYGGAQAAACYAVVSYIICIIQLLLQGIGDGCQPLIGNYYGANNLKSVKEVRKMAYITAFTTSLVCMIAIYLLKDKIPNFFGVSDVVAQSISSVLPIFISGFLFIAFLRITTSFFYAVRKNLLAYILIYGEPLLLTALVALVLPNILGLKGVWISVPLTQACLAVVGFILLKKYARFDTL